MLLDGILVALGGAGGSLLRYLLGLYLPAVGDNDFPIGTLAVNLLGSLIIGFIFGYTDTHAPIGASSMRLLLATGFCGGFTTFSTFSWEGMRLIASGAGFTYILYVILSILLGLLSVYIGYLIAQTLQ